MPYRQTLRLKFDIEGTQTADRGWPLDRPIGVLVYLSRKHSPTAPLTLFERVRHDGQAVDDMYRRMILYTHDEEGRLLVEGGTIGQASIYSEGAWRAGFGINQTCD
jgi:hypothetical protein